MLAPRDAVGVAKRPCTKEMSMKPGNIGWVDLTVDDAGRVRDFYEKVVGWKSGGVDMGGYQDFGMVPPGEEQAIAGVCHARGSNEGLPPYWLIYIVVADLDDSLRQCEGLGGKTVAGPKNMGDNRYAVIEDPAGAFCALFEPGK
jgi:predicted enzyme related to lactoylglutathione lyase